MKMEQLHENQMELLHHLALFHMLDYATCLRLLDKEHTKDWAALSYQFRPLSRYNYLSKKGDVVQILAKGRWLFPEISPLISLGGGRGTSQRLMEVSRVGAWLGQCGIPSTCFYCNIEYPAFIPSACWRKINTAVLSTARFAGMFIRDDHRLAVYDIGDGTMEWQLRAEGSLFYTQHRATGMILICHEDKRTAIAQQIIRQTMWARRQLLARNCVQREKPVRWSRSPIKLKKQYQQVFLTTPERLQETLNTIQMAKVIAEGLYSETDRLYEPSQGDFEQWPKRGFVNPATDLLKYIYLFSTLKDGETLKRMVYTSPLRYVLYANKADCPIFEMYGDLLKRGEVCIYDCATGNHLSPTGATPCETRMEEGL